MKTFYMKNNMTALKAMIFVVGLTGFYSSHAQEVLIRDETFTWTESSETGGGYHYWTNFCEGPQGNWTSPYNYKGGTWQFRFDIQDKPTTKANRFNLCVWTEFNSSTVTWKEDCFSLSPYMTSEGVYTWTGTRSAIKGGGIDWTNLTSSKLWHFGLALWKDNCNMAINGYTTCPGVWQYHSDYLPMRLRFTIVAVASGYSFSGWSNYPSGIGCNGGGVIPVTPPIPTYSITYSSERTSKVVPSTDEFSYSSNMSGAISGSGAYLNLTPGQDVYFRTKAQGINPVSAIQHLVVPTRASAPSFSFAYATEKTTTTVSSEYEYSTHSDMSSATTGTGTNITVTPGTTMYFRKKATSSAFASSVQTLVIPARPATPTFVLDPVNFRTSTIVTSDYEYSDYSDMSGAISGNGTYVAIPNGTTKYFRKKATGSSFSSGIQALNANTPPTNNEFIAYWPLDNSGSDISGRNHNLTLFNGATYSTDKKLGSHSLSLDGVDDYAISNAINLGNEFTIVMWSKLNLTTGIRTLIANAPSGNKASGFKFMINTYGINDRRIIFESGDGTSGLHSTTSAINAYSFNVWNHVALVVNRSTGVATIYYNGSNVTSISGSHTVFNTNAVLWLGRMTNNQWGMGGLLDDVRIYDKMLSQGEIQAIMSGNVPELLNPPTSLTATLAGNSAQLSWRDNAAIEDGFRVERSFDSLTGYNEIASLPANVTVYTDNGISTPATKYFYKVRAFNNAGNSTYSNIASVTTDDNPQPDGEFIAYWLLDNSGSDISGNNHNLTLFNGATYSSDKKRGTHSLSLDGVDDYASSDAINLGNVFTIMMWAKLNAAANIRTLIANAPSGDKGSGFKFMINTYGTNNRRIIFESGNGSSGLHFTTTAISAFSFGVWNHVALVVNRSTGVAILYYNGSNVSSISGSHTSFNTNAVLRLGRMTNNQFGMSGLLDDVRIYDKVLSQSEIQEVMNNNLKGTEENLATDKTFSFYPNPFLDELILNNTSGIQIQIIDIMGKIRMEIIHPEDKLIRINTQSLIPGIYFIRIIREDGTIQISKAIKLNVL